MIKTLEPAIAAIRGRIGSRAPRIAVVLGSGLGPFADAVTDAVEITYADLPGFPQPGVGGHAGSLRVGRIGATEVAVMQGRAHYYEQGRADGMQVAVHALAALGVETLLLTNAAGSLVEAAGPGAVMLLTDHLNLSGTSPLFGEPGNDRFVDMVDAYDPALREAFIHHAAAAGITLHQGVYAWFHGPEFETPAEIRAVRMLGADAVGMSTVPEVILARHAGLRVAALSIITNFAAGMSATRLSHEQTLANAARAAGDVQRLLGAVIAGYAS